MDLYYFYCYFDFECYFDFTNSFIWNYLFNQDSFCIFGLNSWISTNFNQCNCSIHSICIQFMIFILPHLLLILKILSLNSLVYFYSYSLNFCYYVYHFHNWLNFNCLILLIHHQICYLFLYYPYTDIFCYSDLLLKYNSHIFIFNHFINPHSLLHLHVVINSHFTHLIYHLPPVILKSHCLFQISLQQWP